MNYNLPLCLFSLCVISFYNTRDVSVAIELDYEPVIAVLGKDFYFQCHLSLQRGDLETYRNETLTFTGHDISCNVTNWMFCNKPIEKPLADGACACYSKVGLQTVKYRFFFYRKNITENFQNSHFTCKLTHNLVELSEGNYMQVLQFSKRPGNTVSTCFATNYSFPWSMFLNSNVRKYLKISQIDWFGYSQLEHSRTYYATCDRKDTDQLTCRKQDRGSHDVIMMANDIPKLMIYNAKNQNVMQIHISVTFSESGNTTISDDNSPSDWARKLQRNDRGLGYGDKTSNETSFNATYLSGNGTNLSGNGTYLSGNGTDLSGNGTYLSGNGTYLIGNGTYLSGNGTYLSGNGTYLSGNGTYLSGNGTDLSGSAMDMCGNATNLSRNDTDEDVSNTTTTVPTTLTTKTTKRSTRATPAPTPKRTTATPSTTTTTPTSTTTTTTTTTATTTTTTATTTTTTTPRPVGEELPSEVTLIKDETRFEVTIPPSVTTSVYMETTMSITGQVLITCSLRRIAFYGSPPINLSVWQNGKLLISRVKTDILRYSLTDKEGGNLTCGITGAAVACLPVDDTRTYQAVQSISSIKGKQTIKTSIDFTLIFCFIQLMLCMLMMLWTISLVIDHVKILANEKKIEMQMQLAYLIRNIRSKQAKD